MRDNEIFVKSFHDKHPGCTARAFSSGKIDGSGSSYDLAASVVPSGPGELTVVDIGCGDGFLLEILAQRAPNASLVGVDMSGAELELSRGRASLQQASFRRERAQALGLDTGSVDFAVSHLALMWMQDVEQVLGEIARVLKPGAKLSAVVSRKSELTGALALFADAFKEAVAAHGAQPIALGDSLLNDEVGLQQLFSITDDYAHLEFRDVDLVMDAPAEVVWSSLRLSYDLELLSAQGKSMVENEFKTGVVRLAGADGLVPYSMPMRHLVATRSDQAWA